ncbi:hypothetical protein Z517_11014 [Fonsecaea pedrosoi CBS 271.37]|uniref:DUF6604 domain-containing protein n=1 Tax=Fonsecaea pedrosoi CBS 271.37 TaxID=1442368 RepID=A0A0D2G6I1_9EURO|nr:uncharacterized protein Z517_11014 [Fonsecaea pedrosoi CBS 271.37]KIW76268.1 hypothetical protein Z517_11014 [Fonsecaea pedrosoi CBS 271.37]
MAKPSLPPSMVSAYKQYKQDTETVAGWLAEKSAQAGYASNIKQPRPEAKARRSAQGTTRKAQRSKTMKPVCIVRTAELVEMAKCIVKLRPKVILSRSMQVIWERTIRARREFSRWFRSKAATNVVLDEKHSHFASLLELALETLRPCYEIVKESKPTSQKKETDKGTPRPPVNNIFQHLKVEDLLSDEEVDQEDTTNITCAEAKPGSPRAQIDFDDPEAESEFLFAIWSFMQEVFAVRTYVASTWHLYASGSIELMQAAAITNLAVDLVRKAEAELEASLQRPPAYPAARYPTGSLPFLIFKLHVVPSYQCKKAWDADLPMVFIICGCSICDVLLYIPWGMARTYIHILKEMPPTFPSLENEFRVRVPPFPSTRVCDPRLFHAQNPSQKAKSELSRILPNFSLLSLMLRGKFIEDEILHAARHILENRNCPIWVSLALQIQLDIQRVGTIKTIRAFQDLNQAFDVIKLRVEEHQKWYETHGVEIRWKWHDHLTRSLDGYGIWIKGKICSKSEVNDAGVEVPLMKDFPVTCGTMKTELHLEWHTLGLVHVNSTLQVPMLCHLYNALRIVAPQSPVWPDMELVIRNQNPEKIFVGGRPETLGQARNRFLLSSGVSITSLAKDSRGFRFRKNPAVRPYEQSPIAKNLFVRWQGQETRKIDEAAHRLQEHLFSRQYFEDLERHYYVAAGSPAQTPPQRTLSTLRTKMVRTLGRLSDSFAAEMPGLMFDYFSMERRCSAAFEHLAHAIWVMADGGVPSVTPVDHPAANALGLTIDIFNEAFSLQMMICCLESQKRTVNRAQRPAAAKRLKSMLPQFQNESGQVYLNALTHLRNGRIGEVLGKCAGLSENAAAARAFGPLSKWIENLVNEQKGDAELLKLRRVVGTKDYGICLFRPSSLEALYGPGKEQSWGSIVVAESVIKEAMLCRAANPVVYLAARLFLHQEKMTCGAGADSYGSSGLKAGDVKDLEREMTEYWFKGNPNTWEGHGQSQKEDWEKWEGIYGREGRLARK